MKEREKHMEILEKAFFDNLEYNDIEFGTPWLHPKRPFGNSYVEGDILEMLEIEADSDEGYSEKQDEYASDLFSDLVEWLQKKYGSRK